jgi:hypothetical protein
MTTFKTIDVRRPDQFRARLVALNRSHATYGSALFRTLQASERCFSHVWRMTDRFAPVAAVRTRMLWMSAFHLGADIAHARSQVSFVPTGDIARARNERWHGGRASAFEFGKLSQPA